MAIIKISWEKANEEVYEKIDGKFIYNATTTEKLNKIEKE